VQGVRVRLFRLTQERCVALRLPVDRLVLGHDWLLRDAQRSVCPRVGVCGPLPNQRYCNKRKGCRKPHGATPFA
jgi:hypothetical protein